MSSGVADILPTPIEGGDLLGFAFPPPVSEDSMFCKVSFIDNRVDTTPTNNIYKTNKPITERVANVLS